MNFIGVLYIEIVYNNYMKRSGLPPLGVIIVIAFIIGISEVTLRILTSSKGFIFLSDAALFIWGLIMLSGGIFSLSSYFFETKWRGFQGLIWVYKTIIPVGGKVNAIIFGMAGILTGAYSIIRVFMS